MNRKDGKLSSKRKCKSCKAASELSCITCIACSDPQLKRYPIYELFSLHLLPLLHEESEKVAAPSSVTTAAQSPTLEPRYHALLTSHHLVSTQKRRAIRQWSSDLSISGFAKVGHPGVIYGEGAKENLEEFVANIKSMQWLALRVRFIEPVETHSNERPWVEFQKVGKVVEEMKRIGREEFVLEMGIGSTGSN